MARARVGYDRGVRRLGLVLTLLGVLVAGPLPALAARPDPGTEYSGKTSQERPLKARVSSSGRGLELRFPEKFNCTGVPDRLLKARYVRDRPTIRTDGTFNYFKRYTRLTLPDFPGRFSETQRITGRFSGDLRRVTGRSSVRITGKNFSCRATLTFSARRVP